MLILSRKAGEALVIDGGLRISILGTDGRTVRIGIEAPAQTRILRAEILEEVQRETVAAQARHRTLLELAPPVPPAA